MTQLKKSTIIPTMTREEQIKKVWESGFKNVVESLDTERTKEDVACMFFELGCRWADESRNVDWQQVRIQAAIAAMRELCVRPEYNSMSENVVAAYSVRYADALVKELKGE